MRKLTDKFAQAMINGSKLMSPVGELTIEVRDVGSLVLPTGKVVGCDPCSLLDEEPFTVEVNPGIFSVFLSLASYTSESGVSDLAPVISYVTFQNEPVARWQLAVKASWNPSSDDNEIYGYGVDSGVGCFIDAGAVFRLKEKLKDSQFGQLITPAYAKNTFLDPTSGINIVTFGAGDGEYPSFWGIDAREKPVCLATYLGGLFVDLDVEAG